MWAPRHQLISKIGAINRAVAVEICTARHQAVEQSRAEDACGIESVQDVDRGTEVGVRWHALHE
jgi:hypothetical protein